MFEQILVVVSVTFLVMVSPGPDMVLVLRNTFVAGRRAGLETSVGILCGNLVHVTYCVLGLGWLISQSIRAFSVLKYAAAAYLIYLGLTTLRSDAPSLSANAMAAHRASGRWFGQGFVSNVLNPKGTLFYLGIFTMVITLATSLSDTLVLILCMMLVSVCFWLTFVFTLDRPPIRRVIGRCQRTVNRIFGALLLLLGLKLATESR